MIKAEVALLALLVLVVTVPFVWFGALLAGSVAGVA